MSSYKNLDVFGSGPHRFSLGRQGNLLTQDYYNGGSGAGTSSQGLVQLDVTVRGRLTAASDAALWTLRDALKNQLAHPMSGGTLVDNTGRSWTGMALVRYVEATRRDKGRVFSIRYTAQFRKIA